MLLRLRVYWSSSSAHLGVVAGALLLLAIPAAAREPRALRLRFPRLAVPAAASTEACVLLRLPAEKPFDLVNWEIRTRTTGAGMGTLHFLVYLYTGEHVGDFSTGTEKIVPSRGCLDLGPVDRDRRELIASGTGGRSRAALPKGVALPLSPAPGAPGSAPDSIGILLDGNWSNNGSRTGFASARVVLRRAAPHAVRRLAKPILERGAEIALEVPPNEGRVKSTEESTAAYNVAHPALPPLRDGWGAGDACMLMVTGHMHKRGRFFGVDLIGTDGAVHNPPGGFPNRFEQGRTHLFGSPDYTDPGALKLSPRLLHAGETLHYACWDDNGVTTTFRLGCEETPGVPPGLPGSPAKPCFFAGPVSSDCPASDAQYLGRTFTGACVSANLVAGATPDDEACALAGWYFDAVPGAPAGSECDVTALPALH
ncbi:MAG: hypothetical protein E6J79_14945 [Deltaproteobacteria bacterium]|nr:MAG: hypothetical protein E6J79_14945 [Deltaproteobacteria bacterium]